MINAWQHEAAIKDINEEIAALQKKREQWLQEWAALVSPWKVGDVLAKPGYGYEGKPCRVIEVKGRLDYSYKPKVWVKAVMLKADGTDSKNFGEWNHYPKRSAS